MHRIVASIGGLALIAVALTGFIQPKEQKWTSLFDGKTLNGWKPKITGYAYGENFGDTFRVHDGVIAVSYDKYGDDGFKGRFGHLFYKQPFSNYRFRCTYRFIGAQAKGGDGWAYKNSGIMLHCQPPDTMAKDQKFPVSIECQLLGGDAGQDRPTANVCTPGTNIVMDGKLITQHCTNSTSKTFVGDQWVTTEVEVHGNKVTRFFVNGEEVLQYEKPQLDPTDDEAKPLIKDGQLMLGGGYISLQSESHPCEFKNIEILPLND